MQINQHHTNNIAFGKFYKVKGNHHDIKRLRNNFFEKDNKFLENNNYTKEEVLSGFKQLLVQSGYNNLLYIIKDDE